MRIALAWIVAWSLSWAGEFDYVKSYRQGGLKAVEEQLERALVSPEYWRESLKGQEVRLGYYESVRYLFVADKEKSELSLYGVEAGQLKPLHHSKALMGSKKGDKRVEGDLKTPIGVYDLTARLTKLDQFYGPLAFVTSYPNLYDSLQKKSGSGIWIHGVPLNGDREINTRGCIALDNKLLSALDSMIDHKESLLITGEGNLFEVQAEELAILLSDLFKWRNAWKFNDLENYLGFYDKEDFLRFDKMRFEAFANYKRRIFSRNERKSILFNNINISPYPNERGERFFRIDFHESYKAPSYTFEGKKELYVKLEKGKMQIVAEK